MEILNELVGLETVKETLDILVKTYKYKRENGIAQRTISLVFTGNPGTGKTVVARLITKEFSKLKMVKEDKFTQISASKLISGYVGHTAKQTKDILEKASGGVLFIDEIYALTRNDFGKEAISEILLYMENEEISIILADSGSEIEKLFEMNLGIEPRINKVIHFPDYTVDELMELLKLIIEKHPFTIDVKALDVLRDWVNQKITKDASRFGNGRGIKNVVNRLYEIIALKEEDANIINKEDIEKKFDVEKQN